MMGKIAVLAKRLFGKDIGEKRVTNGNSLRDGMSFMNDIGEMCGANANSTRDGMSFGKDGGEKRAATVAAERGAWGEGVTADHLMTMGWKIVDRNVRPCKRDQRCEIDIIAFEPEERTVVFVEVKTHIAHSDMACRLWGVDKRKKKVLLRGCASWLMKNRWHGNYRFDVVEVYGEEGGVPPEIDHIRNVPLFPSNWRWW